MTQKTKNIRSPRCTSNEEKSLISAMQEDIYQYDAYFQNEEIIAPTYDHYHFNGCRFQDITCSIDDFFENEYLDCIFTHCDLSAADLQRSHFYRCHFENCRLTGTRFYDCVWKDVTWNNCMCQYANFGGSHFERCAFTRCTIKEGGFIQCQQKSLAFQQCDLQSCSFVNTSLKEVHLENNKIDGLLVNEDSLKGVYVSPQQAILLASLLGIHIVEE